jgi:hypothetical protein
LNFFGLRIYSPATSEEIIFELQGRWFHPGDITRALLCMCGGHFNSFYVHALKLPIAEILNLFELWQDVQKQSRPTKNSPFDDVSYE